MRSDTERYLAHLCDDLTAQCDRAAPLIGAGAEPYAVGAALRFSPTRIKAVMRELVQHHLVDIAVVVGSDGQNELRLIGNRETERWYARTLRWRRIQQAGSWSRPAPPQNMHSRDISRG